MPQSQPSPSERLLNKREKVCAVDDVPLENIREVLDALFKHQGLTLIEQGHFYDDNTYEITNLTVVDPHQNDRWKFD